MSEQINEQVVDEKVDMEEVLTPEVEVPTESLTKPQTQVFVLPTKASVGQRIIDTAVTMVASTVVVGFTNIVVDGTTKLVSAGAKKIKSVAEARKEKKIAKKAEKEAAKLEAAKAAQEIKAVEATPETVES